MTYEAMDWAMRQELPAMPKLVLVMLANTAECDDSAQVTAKVLAKQCGMGLATVKRHISDLANRGLLRVIGRAESGPNTPNTYVLVRRKARCEPYNAASGEVKGQ